jgi:hypothetical protein
MRMRTLRARLRAAGLLVVVALAAWAQAWRSVIRSCGGDVGRADAVARYTIGSAVNTLTPARLGDVVRIALFSRKLGNRERGWTSAGAYTTIGAARTLTVAALVPVGYAAGALPFWPVPAAAGVADRRLDGSGDGGARQRNGRDRVVPRRPPSARRGSADRSCGAAGALALAGARSRPLALAAESRVT